METISCTAFTFEASSRPWKTWARRLRRERRARTPIGAGPRPLPSTVTLPSIHAPVGARDRDRSALPEYGIAVGGDQLAGRVEPEVAASGEPLAGRSLHDERAGPIDRQVRRDPVSCTMPASASCCTTSVGRA